MKFFCQVDFFFVTLFLFTLNAAARDYQFPDKSSLPLTAEVEMLQKIDKAYTDLAQQVSKGVVFIGVSKEQVVTNQFDLRLFEEFFGPGARDPRFRQQREIPPQKIEGVGSGFIIDKKEGYILTNNHVVGEADEISVTLYNGKKFKATVIGTDPKTDIAVIRVTNLPEEVENIYFAESEKVKVGQMVLAVGAPHGLAQTVTRGTVSAKNRGSMEITAQGDFIQTDAAINPGNSGGPLVDSRGEAIGMSTAIISRTGGSQGIGLAIPAHILKNVAEKLIRFGKVSRSMLGVVIQNLSEDLAQDLGLKGEEKGALVVQVAPGSPAQKGGISHGDLIVAVDKHQVSDASGLSYLISLSPVDRDVVISLLRQGQKKEVKIRLESSEPLLSASSTAKENGSSRRKKDEDFWGMKLVNSKMGPKVTSLILGEVAERSGLKEGDIVLEVNQKSVKSVKDVFKYDTKKERVLLRILRQDHYFYVSLRK